MDLANTLIRTVVRTFYETRHILVVDALFIHSVYVLGLHGLKSNGINTDCHHQVFTPKILHSF